MKRTWQGPSTSSEMVSLIFHFWIIKERIEKKLNTSHYFIHKCSFFTPNFVCVCTRRTYRKQQEEAGAFFFWLAHLCVLFITVLMYTFFSNRTRLVNVATVAGEDLRGMGENCATESYHRSLSEREMIHQIKVYQSVATKTMFHAHVAH